MSAAEDIRGAGTVPSQEQASKATTTATRVPGVGTVHNLLAVALPDQDYGDDAALSASANEALAGNAAVPTGVKATSRFGSITLTGEVSTAAAKSAAEDAVAGVGGVVSISNDIVVAGSSAGD